MTEKLTYGGEALKMNSTSPIWDSEQMQTGIIRLQWMQDYNWLQVDTATWGHDGELMGSVWKSSEINQT